MEKYYTTKEVAEKIGVTVRHVARLCIGGTFEYITIGKNFLITKVSVEKYISKKERAKPSGDGKAR